MLDNKKNNIITKEDIDDVSEGKRGLDVAVKKTRKRSAPEKSTRTSARGANEKKVDDMMEKISKKMENKGRRERSGKGRFVWVAVIILLVLCISAGAAYFLMDMKRKNSIEIQKKDSIIEALEKANREISEKQTEKTQEVEKKEAQVPAEATADISKLDVNVLNESGIAGSAGKITEFLVAKGYAKAEAGNGEATNTVGTTVYYKSDDLKKEAEKIAEVLKEKKIVAKISKAGAGQQSGGEIVIILGK